MMCSRPAASSRTQGARVRGKSLGRTLHERFELPRIVRKCCVLARSYIQDKVNLRHHVKIQDFKEYVLCTRKVNNRLEEGMDGFWK